MLLQKCIQNIMVAVLNKGWQIFFSTPPFLPCEGHQPHVLLVTLLPGSVGLSLHLLGSPEPWVGKFNFFYSLNPNASKLI